MSESRRKPATQQKDPKAKKYPRKSAKTTGQGKKKVQWQGYINYQQDTIDKAHAEELRAKPEWFDKAMQDVLSDDYKVSVTWSDYHSCMVASLYCQDADSDNAGWCLTARASGYYDAMFRVLFLHHICFEGDWTIAMSHGERTSDTW